MSPYTCDAATTVSPERTSVTSVVAIAAMPLAVISACGAWWSLATSAAAASTVGLLNREYQVSCSPPVPWMSSYARSSSSNVVVW